MGKQKHNLFRFTLQFNETDPHHKACVDILNQQGKSISNFIVNAVLHYMDCGLHPVSSMFIERQIEQGVERIVEMAIEKYKAGTEPAAPPEPVQAPSSPIPQPRRPAPPPTPEGIDDESLRMLGDGLNALR